GDVQGYGPLREAIADYLGTSRGVDCTPDEIVILSGTQQALDLLARFVVKRCDSRWIADPACHGAAAAFRHAGARLVPVPGAGDVGRRDPRGQFQQGALPLVATWLPGAAAIPHGSFSRVPLSGRCVPSGTPGSCTLRLHHRRALWAALAPHAGTVWRPTGRAA